MHLRTIFQNILERIVFKSIDSSVEKAFKIFIAIQIIYLCVTLFYVRLPGWKMFINIDRVSFSLFDENEQVIDHSRYMVKPVYSLTKKQVKRVSVFICKKTISRKIVLIFSGNEKYEIEKPNCKITRFK